MLVCLIMISFCSPLDWCFLFDMGGGGISRKGRNHDQTNCKLPYFIPVICTVVFLSLTECAYLQSLPFQSIQHIITAQDHHPTPDSCVMSMVMGQLKVRCDQRLHLLKQMFPQATVCLSKFWLIGRFMFLFKENGTTEYLSKPVILYMGACLKSS